MSVPRILGGSAIGLVSVLALAGCASQPAAEAGKNKPAAATVTVEDNHGTHEVSLSPASVVATDNRTFQTLADWGIDLSAAARALMPATNSYKDDESIIDLGNHREPDLEALVAAEPDLIINGQRFAQYYGDIAALAPDATIDHRAGPARRRAVRRRTEAAGDRARSDLRQGGRGRRARRRLRIRRRAMTSPSRRSPSPTRHGSS